ncbi:hypothetical protein [Flavobacterium algicola]|uniref:hypothetical protein n=1 Tax=Flavobacterium algicola TaxID=556529 RepID=UPI001EFE2705|nr:hypothetical protein [Flavobacterium algicola]MCG9792090.1 hypothetical protein [Flavobacterium algicola]
MKKTSLKKLLVVFSALLALVYGTIYACGGGGDWGWSFDSNFTPETFVDQSYRSLFLSTDIFYGDGFDNKHNSRFNDEIVQDWSAYLKGVATTEDVHYFLIDSSAIAVKELNTFYRNKRSSDAVEKWKNKVDLKNSRFTEFVQFLYLAQELESVSINNDYWSYEPVVNKVYKGHRLVPALIKKYNSVTDSFLKNRYWFQIVKTYFYSDDYKNTINFFQSTADKTPKNVLYYRALSYVAGVNYKQKQYALSNYQFSQVFDQCPPMRVVTAYCFRPQEEADWQQSLAMAKNNDEKVALWALSGYYTNEEKSIEKIYELNPKSEHLDYLLTRLVNRLELKTNKSFEKITVSENKKSTKDSLTSSSTNLVFKITDEGKVKNEFLWNTAAGYLATLKSDYKKSDSYYKRAEKYSTNTPLAINQLRLLKFVNSLSKVNNVSDLKKADLSKELNWLYFEIYNLEIADFRFENAINWSKTYISTLFKADKNQVFSELFVRTTDFYDKENNLRAMKTFLDKSNKSDFELIAEKVYDVHSSDILEYEAIRAAFSNKIPEAIQLMQQAGPAQNYTLLGNPFNGTIKDCHDCDHIAKQSKKYSKLDLLNTMNLMQDKLAANEEVYSNALLLGNAFYNMSHYGNARVFYESNIIGYGFSEFDFRDKMRGMLTNTTQSKLYYKKALSAATTDEQRAKCHYLLSKCERNDYYNLKYKDAENYWDRRNDGINFLAWKGFNELYSNYSDTKYYQEVITECGYFDSYVRQQ